jgi:hypothetical protein
MKHNNFVYIFVGIIDMKISILEGKLGPVQHNPRALRGQESGAASFVAGGTWGYGSSCARYRATT